MAGGRASGAVDDFEGLTEDRWERERVIETAVLHFTVNGGVTSGGGFRRRNVGVSQQGNRRRHLIAFSPNGESEEEEEREFSNQ